MARKLLLVDPLHFDLEPQINHRERDRHSSQRKAKMTKAQIQQVHWKVVKLPLHRRSNCQLVYLIQQSLPAISRCPSELSLRNLSTITSLSIWYRFKWISLGLPKFALTESLIGKSIDGQLCPILISTFCCSLLPVTG